MAKTPAKSGMFYNLPLPGGSDGEKVLPIDTSGGAGGIRTRYLLPASQTFSQVNYGPLSPNVILHE